MQWSITSKDKYTQFVILMSKIIFISVITLFSEVIMLILFLKNMNSEGKHCRLGTDSMCKFQYVFKL